MPDLAPLAFIDTETTGLDPHRHEIWEVGLIVRPVDRHEDGHMEHLADREYVWQLPVDLGHADPIALNIGRFHDRRVSDAGTDHDADAVKGTPAVLTGIPVGGLVHRAYMTEWAARFVELTHGAHLVGAVVSFDERRLWDLLRRLGQCPMWHYHVIDVEALAAGWIAALPPAGGQDDDRTDLARPPWKSEELSRAVGVDPGQFDRHTALGDARWAMAMYDAVMGGRDG